MNIPSVLNQQYMILAVIGLTSVLMLNFGLVETQTTNSTEIENGSTPNVTTPNSQTVSSSTEVITENDTNATVPFYSTTSESSFTADVTTVNQTTQPDTTIPYSDNSSTIEPTPSMAPTSCPGRSGFDVASFIGGIVLCGGLIAIVFLGCKYYRSKSDRNYSQF